MKRGRRPVPVGEERHRQVRIGLTEAQYASVSEGARRSGLSVCNIIRSFLLPLFVPESALTRLDQHAVVAVNGRVHAIHAETILAAAAAMAAEAERAKAVEAVKE
jgi:hypothetical protein